MEIIKIEKENWITKKAKPEAFATTLMMIVILIVSFVIYQNNFIGSLEWMPASYNSVYLKGEYWRLWTTLFAHADLAHILGNLFLFIPFAYFLTGHFGVLYFPIIGFFMGGIINLCVLNFMPHQVQLIGASGVVYCMGATYITLAFLIDRRESTGKRILKLSGISLILFFPETFKAEVSYSTHLLGFVLGILNASIIYLIFKNKFKKAYKYEYIFECDETDLIEFDLLNDTQMLE